MFRKPTKKAKMKKKVFQFVKMGIKMKEKYSF